MAHVSLAALALLALATSAQAANLEISVTGLRNDKGTVFLCVFSTPARFPNCAGDPSVISRRLPASAAGIRVNIPVDPGIHAVSVYHDENGNGRMDTNILGIPTEGGGVSNNPAVRWGPPRFGDARFIVPPEGAAIIIAMVYP